MKVISSGLGKFLFGVSQNSRPDGSNDDGKNNLHNFQKKARANFALHSIDFSIIISEVKSDLVREIF